MKGLVLLGGKGTRLRPLTYTGQKQLLKIANKPMCVYAIENLKNAGIKEIGLVVGHTEERVENMKQILGDGSKWGVKFTYIIQNAPKGIADAVNISKDFIKDDTFVVYLGDNILQGGIKEFVKKFEESSYDAQVLLTKHENPSRFGVARFDENNNLVELLEKPENPPSDYVILGIYFFRPSVFEVIKKLKPSKRNELEITDAIDVLIKSKKNKVGWMVVKGWWKDTGKPEDILEANHLILSDIKNEIQGTIDKSVKVIGKVIIGKGSQIKDGSTLKGPLIIGKNCVIANAYIGPYSSIGDNVKIENTEIESSIVLDEAKISTKRRIIDSLIGEMVEIFDNEGIQRGSMFIVGDSSKIIN